MSRVLVIRAEPGLSETLAAGRAMGFDMAGEPLFDVVPLEWDIPDPAGIDALLAGSANVFRRGGAGLAAFKAKPVHAVGEHTAAAARDAGFVVTGVGQGTLQSVLDKLEPPLRVLRLGGAERVKLTVPRGVIVAERACYEVKPRAMSETLAAQLMQGEAVVLLHSAAAARHFAAECNRLSIARSSISIAAIGARVARAAGTGWAALQSAENPRDDELLALARHMCH
ncbi:MAG TPA: uroporphyrinogen-III synthase [Alteraurantiacibacter sp.]